MTQSADRVAPDHDVPACRALDKNHIPSTLLLMLLLLPTGQAALASVRQAAGAACNADLRRSLAELPAERAAERRVIRLLDAKRYQRAVPALQAAMTRYEDPWAGYTLGHLYAAGLGVRRSDKRAAHWYLWSAERGDHFAQRQLADAYLNGVGIRRDPARAAYWFRIGVAPMELAGSDYSLAATYASGTLAPVNRGKERYYLKESLRILHELAREPNGAADFDLGRAYAGGHGVARDRTRALGYFCRALALGYRPAAAGIRKLEEPPG